MHCNAAPWSVRWFSWHKILGQIVQVKRYELVTRPRGWNGRHFEALPRTPRIHMFQHFLTTLLKGIQWKGHHGLALLQYCVIQGADLVPDLCQSRVKMWLSLDKSLFKRQDCYSRNWEVPIFSSYHSTPRRFHPISTRLWAFSLGDPSQPPFSNPSHQRGVNPKSLSSSKRDLKKTVPCNTESLVAQVCHNRITFTKFTPCGKLSVFPMVPIGPTTVFQPPVLPLFPRDTGNCWWPHPIHKVAIFHIHLLAHSGMIFWNLS